jgi:hypothetical protein
MPTVLWAVPLIPLVIPFVWVVKIFLDNREWKCNILRASYGDISGIIVWGAIWSGYQRLSGPPDPRPPLYLSFLFLLPVVLDVYRAQEQAKQLKRIVFYLALGLTVIVNFVLALSTMAWFI